MEEQKLDRRQIFKIRDKIKASSAAENSLKAVNSGTLAKMVEKQGHMDEVLELDRKAPSSDSVFKPFPCQPRYVYYRCHFH